MSAVIEIEGLSKVYIQDFIGSENGKLKIRFKDRRRVAVEDLDLKVEEGQIFGLLGPNGAGKTTTIKILMGLHFATSGTARIMGKPLGDNTVKSKIGFLPENPYFYDYLTGEEFLNYYGQLYGMPRSLRNKRIPELLTTVGLGAAGDVQLRGYSKGMLQRVGLAQALLNDPKLVILDEPQSGLDPFGRKEVRDLIVKLKEQGRTVMFSSHILSDAEMICDRVAILHHGRLIAEGQMSELLSTRVEEFEVSMRDAKPDLAEFARKASSKTVESGRDLLVTIKSEEDAQNIVRRLSQGEGTLLGYTPRRESLEGYFIREIEEKRASEKAASGGAKHTPSAEAGQL